MENGIDLILERVCQQHARYTRDRKTGSVIIHVHYLDGVAMAIETTGNERETLQRCKKKSRSPEIGERQTPQERGTK